MQKLELKPLKRAELRNIDGGFILSLIFSVVCLVGFIIGGVMAHFFIKNIRDNDHHGHIR